MSIVPSTRPQASREAVLAFITDGEPLPAFPFLVGRRGYYADRGHEASNTIDAYDDAMWLVEENAITAFSANCDPSAERDGMASLKAGRWLFGEVIHNQSKPCPPHVRYSCLGQLRDVVITRFNTESFAAGVKHPQYGFCLGNGVWRGMFGIHIHHGGENTTTSEGCQTVPLEEWGVESEEFMDAYRVAIGKVGARNIIYILTEHGS
jgi:lysozyme